MSVSQRASAAVARQLPPNARRRLGRIKRAVLDQPEPVARGGRRPPPRKRKPAAVAPVATAEGPPGWSRIEVRRSHVLAGTAPDAKVLEIGPAHHGTLPRRDGYRTSNLDYLDRAGLVEKYADFEQYDPEDIEEVDYVLDAGGDFASRISDRFDVVLASHVLEHTTTMVDFLEQCASLLAPSGQVSLVVPDHRFCFDRFRERASLARVVDAHLNPVTLHTPGTLADFTLNAVRHRGTGSWAPGHQGRYSFIHDLPTALRNMESATGPDYIDVHNWIFSPHHLRLLLDDLHRLGLLRLRERYFHPTIGHEFFINLSLDGEGPGLSREELVVLADAERRTLDHPEFRAREA